LTKVALSICVLMAETPLNIVIAVSGKEMLITSWMGYLRLSDGYIAYLPTYTVGIQCHVFT
jgi:hypothetical protein